MEKKDTVQLHERDANKDHQQTNNVAFFKQPETSSGTLHMFVVEVRFCLLR